MDNLKKKMTAQQVEVAVAKWFGYRENLIIPNVSHGFMHYEADLIVVRKSGCLIEVEIKVSRGDLVKSEKKKRHGHNDHRIKHLYFAIPHALLCKHEHIPERAGILILDWRKKWEHGVSFPYFKKETDKYILCCREVRKPVIHSHYKIAEHERLVLARLGALRIWDLKEKLNET